MDPITAEFVSEMTKALVWPFLLATALLLFRTPLTDFLKTAQTGKFKAGFDGIEIELERVATAAAALVAAEAQRNQTVQGQPVEGVVSVHEPLSESAIGRIVTSVNRAVNQGVKHNLTGKNILWVDDKPENNLYERQALEAFGIRIIFSHSTEDALKQLSSRKFDLVISDLSRSGDRSAGFTLLEQKNERSDRTPYILYTARSNPQDVQAALQKGANGLTNNPQELFRLALDLMASNP